MEGELVLVWIDLETTGLVPADGEILEIACIITDGFLNELGRSECVFPYEGSKMVDVVTKMHTESGLLAACAESEHDLALVDEQLATSIKDLNDTPRWKPSIAGFSAHFDLAWIEHHMPLTRACLNHRVFDASTLMIAAKMWHGKHFFDWDKSEVAHRAMADVEKSLWVASRVKAFINENRR